MSLLIGNFYNNKLHISEYKKEIHYNKVKCIGCDNIIRAKKGMINIHHWAHESKVECIFRRDKDCKTEWHMKWQNIVKNDYLEKIIIKNNKKHIADIMNENNIVIEIQHSILSNDEINERELFYNNMIWILDGTDNIVKTDAESYICIKSNEMFITTNMYYIVKFTKKFWCQIKQKKYIDTGYYLYEIVNHIGNNYYICKMVKYEDFLDLYYKNILIYSIKDTIDILISYNEKELEPLTIKKVPGGIFNEVSTKREVIYCEKTNSFNGIGTYDIRSFLYNLGYRFDKNTKRWVATSS